MPDALKRRKWALKRAILPHMETKRGSEEVEPVGKYHGLYGQVSFFAMVGESSVKALCLKCSYGYKQVNMTNTYE